MSSRILTIGHSNHSFEMFASLLRKNRVTAVADVRSVPFSRFTPHFSKEALKRHLKAVGIQYVFLGRELGARSEDASCYENGRVQYGRLARTVLFREGLDRLRRGAMSHRISIMCAEKEPLECHRTLLVSRVLDELGVGVAHILADGRMESHADTMQRLLDLHGLRADLFQSRGDLMAEALMRQELRIAYVDEESVIDQARRTT